MAEPFLLLGGAALIFYFLLGGDDKKKVVPPVPPPVDPPPPGITEAEMLAAHEAGVADGYKAGLDDGSAGAPHAPTASEKYTNAQLQATYTSAFNAGYSLGYDEGLNAKKEFTLTAEKAAEKGFYDGMLAGKTDAASEGPFAPNPPYQTSWNTEMNAIYQSNYTNGYNQGYTEVKAGGGGVAGFHYAKVEKQHHAGVRGLAQQNGGKFKNIILTASVKGVTVEAAVLGEPRLVKTLGREAMPAVVMSAGPYHGHKLIIVE